MLNIPTIGITIALLLYPGSATGYKYQVVFENEEIFTPCRDDPNSFWTSDFNMDNLTFEYISDDEININGQILVVGDSDPTDTIFFETEPVKLVQGQWTPTVFTIRRTNFCRTAFNTDELWYQLTRHIPSNERVCPAPKGHIFNIDNMKVKMEFDNIPDPYLNGEYKSSLKTKLIDKDGVVKRSYCVEALFNVYRVNTNPY